ncbi:MAG TPA: PEP-CTERM sorting domain-containing protein [Rhizomicrobium sp.]|nr:PEP-CTERM sorting domain-containing protein [Rhizomicrobium sp.]
MKRFLKWTLSAALAAGFFSPAPLLAGPILWISDTNGNIGQVDIASGSVVAGSVHNTGLSLTDIGFNSTGTLYGTTFTNLYSLDTGTGAATSLGSYSGIGGGGMNSLVGGGGVSLLGSSALTTQLYSIDPANPAGASVAGPAPLTSAGDLAFSGATLYGSGIDPASGDNSLLNFTTDSVVSLFHVGSAAGPTLNSVFGLADDGTTMYAVNGTEVYSVDLATAVLTPLFDYSLNENGQALADATGSAFTGEGSTQVPEPFSLSLFGTGLAALAAWRARRRVLRKA